MSTNYADWIGNTEETEEAITLAPVLAAAAMLDDTTTNVRGRIASAAALALVLLPAEGGAVPPRCPTAIPSAAASCPPSICRGACSPAPACAFRARSLIGRPAMRHSVIRDVSTKEGRTGRLAFVTVQPYDPAGRRGVHRGGTGHRLSRAGRAGSAPRSVALPPVPAGAWTRTVTPDPILLFRFSALTFNAHRIHYDRPYAMAIEGYPGLVVHGPLTAVMLLELVRWGTSRTGDGDFRFAVRRRSSTSRHFAWSAIPSGNRVELEAQGPDGRSP